ncbi:MAG: hypothetical protein MPJ78_05460 [Hyphomicrobiaceae bacterium]|nr:hypothetical protein [Hyphomicrobiaceae bacterium]
MAKLTAKTLIVNDSSPSRDLLIGDLSIGDAVEQTYTFDAHARRAFSQVANDRAPVHMDDRFAGDQGFRGQIIQGLCVSTRFSRLIGMYLPGEHAILEGINLQYRLPTYEGQTLVYRTEVIRLLKPMKVVRLGLSVKSAQGLHVDGEAQCIVR